MRVVLSRSAWFLLFLLSLISGVAEGQSAVVVHHQVKLGEVQVLLGEWQKSDSNVSVRIDKLRWYVSLPTAEKKGCKAWLLDLSDSASLNQIYMYPTRSDRVVKNISLLFGIDSAIQVGGVGTGALDPARGMYWTWQTGYVQWKMEGAIRVDGLESPLELHLGGFDGATKSQSMLSDYLIYPTTNSVIAQWNISPFLVEVVRRKKFGVMSPSPIARDYCRIIANGVSFHK